VGVQQKLMRHAQVSTTMNVYGNALMDAKREDLAKTAKPSRVFRERSLGGSIWVGLFAKWLRG
jgi:hypothetical protein